MKHMKKILTFLLIVAIVLTISPAMAVGEQPGTDSQPSVTLGTTELGSVKLEQGTPSSYVEDTPQDDGAVEKKLNEPGFDKVLPVFSYYGNLYAPVNYGVPADNSVVLSNPGVIDNCSFSLRWGLVSNGESYPCLTFEYRAANPGTTKVTLTFFYNYGLLGISGGQDWHQKTVTFNVTVSEEASTAPAKPTYSDLKKFRNYVNTTGSSKGAVYLWCNDNYDHHAWFDYITEVEGGYSLGDVVANDGSNTKAPVAQYPWMCEMTIYARAYLDAYNDQLSSKCGTHYLAEGEPETQTFKWYSDGSKWYFITSNAPVYIDITHTAPVTKYTVTYTDGVDGEEIFKDQSYTVTSGESTPAFQIDGVSAAPSREGYVFLGWSPAVAETVTENVTYTALWEEKLTGVTLKSSIREGSLLFLNDQFTVTATANTAAAIELQLNAGKGEPFEQVGKQVSEDGKTTTFTYRVKQITAAYTRPAFTATATKGKQEPVTGTLSFGVNLRNRIHVTVKRYSDNSVIDNATVVLNHAYPQWNKSPNLTYKNREYRANDWDISNQPFSSVTIQLDGQEYSISKDVNGRDLRTLFSEGKEEVYVEYVIVDPITVEIFVNGESLGSQTYYGTAGETLNYSAQQNSVMQGIMAEGRTITALSSEGLTDNAAVFGSCKTVTVSITAN